MAWIVVAAVLLSLAERSGSIPPAATTTLAPYIPD
jgi:hypothetical protein